MVDAAVSTHWSLIRDPPNPKLVGRTRNPASMSGGPPSTLISANQGQLPAAASPTPVMLLLFTALLPHADKAERAQLNIKTTERENTDQRSAGRS